jgi:hypothetical protein
MFQERYFWFTFLHNLRQLNVKHNNFIRLPVSYRIDGNSPESLIMVPSLDTNLLRRNNTSILACHAYNSSFKASSTSRNFYPRLRQHKGVWFTWFKDFHAERHFYWPQHMLPAITASVTLNCSASDICRNTTLITRDRRLKIHYKFLANCRRNENIHNTPTSSVFFEIIQSTEKDCVF